jgi:hypothetical protein
MANPYHPLAHAVERYNLHLDQDKQTLIYRVSLHDNTLFHPDTASWEQHVREHCPQVFGLLETAAHIAGCKFAVEIQ